MKDKSWEEQEQEQELPGEPEQDDGPLKGDEELMPDMIIDAC